MHTHTGTYVFKDILKMIFQNLIYLFVFIFGCAEFPLMLSVSLAVMSQGFSLVAVCGLLIAVASLVA